MAHSIHLRRKYLRKPSVPVFGGSSSSVLNVVNVENSDNSDTGPVKRNVAKETPTKSTKDLHRQQVITGDPRVQIILATNRQPRKPLALQREIKLHCISPTENTESHAENDTKKEIDW